MYLLIVQVVLQIIGAVLLGISLKRRDSEIPFFTREGSILPSNMRRKFLDDTGYHLYLAGISLLSLGGLAGAIYWLWVR